MSYESYVEATKTRPKIAIETAQFDPRFPNQNATKWCFVSYCDYHRCNKLLENDEKCEFFRKVYRSICPNAWTERWDDLRGRGVFAGDAYIRRPRAGKSVRNVKDVKN